MKTRRKSPRLRGFTRSRRGTAAHNREFLVEYVLRLLVRIGHAERIGANIPKLRTFVETCSAHYPDNPYHNWFHAADVTHTAAWLSQRPAIRSLLSDADVFWLLIAAVAHDLKHPGHGNMWEVKHDTPIARRYGFQSVLENQSIEDALALLREPGCAFTDQMPVSARERGHSLLRELVLATDFSRHAEFVTNLNAVIHRYQDEVGHSRDELVGILLPALLKAADIGNTTKAFPQAVFWAERAMQEIWAEIHGGPTAASRPVWTAQTRKANLCKAQVEFIERNALALFGLLGMVDPEIKLLVGALHDNLLKYQTAVFIRPSAERVHREDWNSPLAAAGTPA